MTYRTERPLDDAGRAVSPFTNDQVVSCWNDLICLGDELLEVRARSE